MLIGLTGPAGSGKSTVARILYKRAGFIGIAFADPVKDMLAVICSPKYLNSDKSTPIEWIGKSGRDLMQTLGTEWGRKLVNVDLWVKIAESRLDAIGDDRDVVVSDVRFENEAAMIRRRGGFILHLTRNGFGLSGHESESGILFHNSDVKIDNTGDEVYTADQLSRVIMSLMEFSS